MYNKKIIDFELYFVKSAISDNLFILDKKINSENLIETLFNKLYEHNILI